MAHESTGGGAGGELPEPECLVPGSGESIGAIRRDDLARDCQLGPSDILGPCNIHNPTRCASGRVSFVSGIHSFGRRG